MTPDEILKKLEIYPDKDAFQLGCTARTTLNVHAQQQRAFNLIWSLQCVGKLGPGKSVGIIGAGIAGITAAGAAVATGASVRVYDKAASVMHLQDGNQTRFLHPNIALWPDPAFGFPLTELPFLNWRAETAGNVVAQLLRQWKTIVQLSQGRAVVQLGCEIERVYWNPVMAPKVSLKIKGRTRAAHHDILIVAAGYGIESPTLSNTPSYWRNDDIAQPVLDSVEKKKYLVSGTGDGGLIDVLRLTIGDFHHQNFIQAVMYDSWLIGQGRSIQKSLNKLTKGVDASTVWKLFIDKKRTPKNAALFLDLRRKDTTVWLNATKDYPSRTKAQLLQRLCVALLIRKGIVRYIPGRLVSVFSNANNERLALIRNDAGDQYLPVDEVIERHDATRTLPKLFPNDPDLFNRLIDKWETTPGRTWQDQYPVGYFADYLKEANLEDSYKIGFLLQDLSVQALRQGVEKCFARLGYNGPCALPREVLDWIERIAISRDATDHIDCYWVPPDYFAPPNYLVQQFTLSLEPCFITQFFGVDPPQSAFSLRIYVPGDVVQTKQGTQEIIVRQRFCLCLTTNSRQLIEELLRGDQLPYHLFRTYLGSQFEKYLQDNFPAAPNEPQPRPTSLVSCDTEVFIVSGADNNERKYFESHCIKGMLQAHSLLRVPIALEILLNRWPTTKVHGIGWAVLHARTLIRTQQQGNRLLQWNPTRYCD